MKIKKAVYLTDTFTDYEGNQRPVTICATSVIQNVDLIGNLSKVLSIGVAIGHINDKDKWNEETGKRIAFNKSLNFDNVITTNRPGFISTELVDALLKKEMEFFKKDPGSYIKGYDEAVERKQTKLLNESKLNSFQEIINKLSDSEKIKVLNFLDK